MLSETAFAKLFLNLTDIYSKYKQLEGVMDMIEKFITSNKQLPKQVENIPKAKEVSPDKKEHSQQPKSQQETISKEKTEKIISSMNDFLKASNTHLKFEFHDELQEFYVAIVDDTTNEIVKEIPSKKLLDMYAAMTDYLGLLVDRKI
jgi:flagellar protein FlaG